MIYISYFNNLVERLLPIERDYFLWLNHHRSEFLDTFMYIYSDKVTWLPISVVFLCILLYKMKWKETILLIICGIIIGMLCDFVSAEFIKPFFARLRPTHHPDYKDLVDVVQNYRGGRFGFISNHAANGFGIAIFLSLLFRYWPFTLATYLWVIVTAYSRIYLGVHFITDIIGGFLWGTLAGLLVYYLYIFVRKKVLHIPVGDLYKPILSHKKAQILMLMILVTVLYIVIQGLFFQISE